MVATLCGQLQAPPFREGLLTLEIQRQNIIGSLIGNLAANVFGDKLLPMLWNIMRTGIRRVKIRGPTLNPYNDLEIFLYSCICPHYTFSHADRMAVMALPISGAENRWVPETKVFAPARAQRRAVSRVIPPSTTMVIGS